MVAEKKTATTARRRKIPDYLIREMIDGQPLYYKGYKDVLRKKKEPVSLLSSTGLQAYILSYLMKIAVEGKLIDKYEILVSNIALNAIKDTVVVDILIYESFLTAEKVLADIANAVPKLALDIDTKVEVANTGYYKYISDKIKTLLGFGTEKVISILTTSRQVIFATPDQPWLTYNWDENIELLDGAFFNIGRYLNEKGIQLSE